MPIANVIVAGALAGIIANVTGYLITGRLFHRFQKATPGTWRVTESWAHYLWASVARIGACIGIALLCALVLGWTHPHDGARVVVAVLAGVALWTVALLPFTLEIALFVNWHKGFVAGLLLDWLLVCVIAGGSAAVALPVA